MQNSRITKISRTILCAALALIVLCASAKTICSQTTVVSIQTPADETDAARRKQLVEALERAQDEVAAARALIPELEKQIASKQQIIDAQTKRQALSDEAITSLQKEVETLQSAILEQQKIIETQTAEANYLKKELDKTNKKLKRARALVKWLIIISAAAGGAAIIK